MSERELKFRTWRPETKYAKAKMIFATLIELLRGIGDDCPDYPAADWDSDAKNIMQFTGRKDRKGRDIYEGDIDIDGAVIEFDKHACIFRIGRNWLHSCSSTCIEIVGNIHENPDLKGGA